MGRASGRAQFRRNRYILHGAKIIRYGRLPSSAKSSTGQSPATLVYEDARVLAFNDIDPQAPTHVLIVPKRHIPTLNDIGVEDEQIIGELVRRAAAIAKERDFQTPAIAPCSIPTGAPARAFFTSICICSAAGR